MGSEMNLMGATKWVAMAWVSWTEIGKLAAFYCCIFPVGLFWAVFQQGIGSSVVALDLSLLIVLRRA